MIGIHTHHTHILTTTTSMSIIIHILHLITTLHALHLSTLSSFKNNTRQIFDHTSNCLFLQPTPLELRIALLFPKTNTHKNSTPTKGSKTETSSRVVFV